MRTSLVGKAFMSYVESHSEAEGFRRIKQHDILSEMRGFSPTAPSSASQYKKVSEFDYRLVQYGTQHALSGA